MTRGGMVAVAIVMIVAGACDSHSGPGGKPASVRGAFDAVGGAWAPPPHPATSGNAMASDCGDPRSGLREAAQGYDSVAVSPVKTAVVSGPGGEPHASVDGPFVRIAALRYADEPAARDAVDSMTSEALARCVVRSVNRYVRTLDPREYEAVPPVKLGSVRTRTFSSGVGGSRVAQAAVDEEVLGGFDNTRTISLAVQRAGTLVVTLMSATSSQSPEPATDARDAGQGARRVISRAGEE